MVTFKHWNDQTFPGRMEVRAMPDELAQNLMDFLLEGKAWHNDVEAIHRKVRDIKQRLRSVAREQGAVTSDGSPSFGGGVTVSLAAPLVSVPNVAAPPSVAPLKPEQVEPWVIEAANARRGNEPTPWRTLAKQHNVPVTTLRRLVERLEMGRAQVAA